tara:strand:- start:64 stop:231 length:168 start_codon:yes stop_codon:yes gene_type:complete
MNGHITLEFQSLKCPFRRRLLQKEVLLRKNGEIKSKIQKRKWREIGNEIGKKKTV